MQNESQEVIDKLVISDSDKNIIENDNADFANVSQAEPEKDSPGFLDTSVAAIRNESLIHAGGRALREYGFEEEEEGFDLEYNLFENEDYAEQVAQLSPEEFINFADVKSTAHFEWKLGLADKERKRNQTLNEAGMFGTLATVTTSLTDAPSIALGLGTAGISKLYQTGRIANAVTTGSVVALENAAIELGIQETSVTRDSSDIKAAAIAGFVMGGAFGYLLPAEQKAVRELANRNHPGHVSAAKNTDPDSLVDEMDNLERFGLKAYLPGSYAKVLFGSGDEETIKLVDRLIETTPLKGNAKRNFTAEGRAGLIRDTQSNRLHRAVQSEYLDWLKENGNSRIRGALDSDMLSRFNNEVGAWLSDTTGAVKVSPQAAKAGQQVQEMFDDMLDILAEADVKGFKEIREATPRGQKWMPRVFHRESLREFTARYGRGKLEELVGKAIKSGDELGELADDVIKKISRGYAKTITDPKRADLSRGFHNINMDDIDDLKYLLDGDEAEALKVLDQIKEMKAQRNPDAGKVSHAKRRMKLDENASIKVGGRDVRFTDLLEKDIRKVADRYIQVMSGWAGLAKEAGIKSDADIAKVIKRLEDVEGEGIARTGKERESLQQVFDLITGKPIDYDPYSTGNQIGRVLRDFNFARVMNQAGFAQLQELSNIIGFAGFRNMIKHVPAIPKMMKRLRDGSLDDELAEQIDWAIAPGTHHIRTPVRPGFDDMGEGFDASTAAGRFAQKADNFVQPLKKVTATMSGLAPITDLFQRLSARAYIQKLANFAGGKNISKAERARLRDAGWSDEDLDAIFKEINKHGKFNSKGTLKSLKFKNFDPDTLDKLRLGVDRVNKRIIQQNDIGSSHPWLHKELGKILFQFRSFIMNAWVKQTIHAVRYRDLQAFTALSTGLLMTSLSYMAQTYLNHGHDPAKLKERLSMRRVGEAAVARHGMASILPQAAASLAKWGTGQDLFQGTRSSGQAASFIQGNPTFSLLSGLANTAGLPFKLLNDDYRLSQQDIRNAQNIMVWKNVAGMSQSMGEMSKDLPKNSVKKGDNLLIEDE